MDVDYDATVYFLYMKHRGDWDCIVPSFHAFLKFATTLGGDEKGQLSHVDPLCYDRKILEHKLAYFRWKMVQRRNERSQKKQAAAAAAATAVPDEDLEDDVVFGGKARPSGHNVLARPLGERLRSIEEEVRARLPSLGLGCSASDTDSDTDGDGSSAPEIFFSGMDWSSVRLPGDEGFAWDDEEAASGGAEADRKLIARNAALEMKEEKSKEKARQQQQQLAAPPALSAQPHPQFASRFAANETFAPTSNTQARLREELAKLDESEREVSSLLADASEAGSVVDFSTLRRMLNPSRPKRPSQVVYDDDGYPANPADLPPAKDADALPELKDDVETASEETPAPAPPAVTAAAAAAAEAAPMPANAPPTAVPPTRPGRWAIIEHSDSESDDDVLPAYKPELIADPFAAGPTTQASKPSAAASAGGGKGKGGKGGYKGAPPASRGQLA